MFIIIQSNNLGKAVGDEKGMPVLLIKQKGGQTPWVINGEPPLISQNALLGRKPSKQAVAGTVFPFYHPEVWAPNMGRF